MSHSKDRVAFLRLHLLNQPLEVQEKINKEKWRFTWYAQSGDREATKRPTEEEAFANIFLDTRGINGRH